MVASDDMIQVPTWGKKAAAAPVTPDPAAATAASSAVASSAQAPAPSASASQGTWLDFPTGESHEVTGRALIGRDPQPRPGEEVDQLIAIGAWEKSVSKTHAVLAPHPEGLVVRDRGSSNGTWVVTASGVERRGAPNEDVVAGSGDRVRLGALEITVR